MQIKTPTMTKSSFKLTVLALFLVPTISWPQGKQSSAPANQVTGYGEASYSLSTSEQYLSTWLVAGPVRMDSTSGKPSEQNQINFFKEAIQPPTVLANKAISPLEVQGKLYPWTIVK